MKPTSPRASSGRLGREHRRDVGLVVISCHVVSARRVRHNSLDKHSASYPASDDHLGGQYLRTGR